MVKQILYVLLPLFVFVILYDVCATLLTYAVRWIEQNFGILQERGTARAICITGALLLTFLCLRKLAKTDGFLKVKKEAWKIPVWQYVMVVLGTVIVSYGMNYLFTVTGFIEKSQQY